MLKNNAGHNIIYCILDLRFTVLSFFQMFFPQPFTNRQIMSVILYLVLVTIQQLYIHPVNLNSATLMLHTYVKYSVLLYSVHLYNYISTIPHTFAIVLQQRCRVTWSRRGWRCCVAAISL